MVRKVGNRNVNNQSLVRDFRDVKDVKDADEIDLVPKVQSAGDSGFIVREQMTTLIAGRRRPPAMKLKSGGLGSQNDPITGEIAPDVLPLLSSVRPEVIAYYVADLSVRLNKLDRNKMSEKQLRGLLAINKVARMFEHLNIMKTNQFH